jgi:hypothetical protein
MQVANRVNMDSTPEDQCREATLGHLLMQYIVARQALVEFVASLGNLSEPTFAALDSFKLLEN